MAYKQVLTLVFRFINSGVVFGLGIYAFKKYIYPHVLKGFSAEKQKIEELNQAIVLLHEAHNQEQTHKNQDQLLYESLKTKIERWHFTCQSIHKKAQEDRVIKEERLHKQVEEQAYQLAKARLIKKTGPRIINQVRTELKHDVSNPVNAHKVITYIIQSLRVNNDSK